MTERREFIKGTLIVAAGMVVAGPLAGSAMAATLPPGLVYTKKNPGMWAAKVGSHAPVVSVEGRNVTIRTNHSMSEKHYIVRHTLVSADGRVLGTKTFYPTDKEPVSTFKLPEVYTSTLYATSFCNKHDFWVTVFNL